MNGVNSPDAGLRKTACTNQTLGCSLINALHAMPISLVSSLPLQAAAVLYPMNTCRFKRTAVISIVCTPDI